MLKQRANAYYLKYKEDLAEAKKMIVEEHGKLKMKTTPLRIAKTSSITRTSSETTTILCASAVFLQSRRKSSTFRLCYQWEIYDRYMGDYVMQIAEQGRQRDKKKRGGSGSGITVPPRIRCRQGDDMVHSQRMGNALRIERMLNQNVDDEIFQDFKYWDDTSDHFAMVKDHCCLCGASTLSD